MTTSLLYNKDIKEISKKAERQSISQDEAFLLRLGNALETNIQQICLEIFNDKMGNSGKAFETRRISSKDGKYKIEKIRNIKAIVKALFVQIDNGNSDAGITTQDEGLRKLMFRRKAVTKRRKAAEGTVSGFPDCLLLRNGRILFVEFKRIGTFKISEEQQYWHDWLNANGFKAYITNNPIYFRDVILKELV